MAERPAGLVYEPDFLAVEDERALLDVLAGLEFQPIEMRGQVARRTALHFGINYDYDHPGRSGSGEPLPDWLLPVREHAAAVAGVAADELVEGLVQRYPQERRSAGTAMRRCSARSSASRSERRPECASVSRAATAATSSSSCSSRARGTCSPARPGGSGSTASRRSRRSA